MLETPSYASGAIMGIFITLSLVIERSIHYLGKVSMVSKPSLTAMLCILSRVAPDRQHFSNHNMTLDFLLTWQLSVRRSHNSCYAPSR
jgi:hypothetical protein